MIAGLLFNGAVASVQLIVVSFLLSRFIRDVVGRALLAIALVIAAAAYVAFAVGAGQGSLCGRRAGGGWRLRCHGLARGAPLAYVARRRLGVASPLGRGAPLLWAGKLVRSHELHDPVHQFRFAGGRLHRHHLWVRSTRRRQSSPPRNCSLALPQAPQQTAVGLYAYFREPTFHAVSILDDGCGRRLGAA
jgi:hypothetical protein